MRTGREDDDYDLGEGAREDAVPREGSHHVELCGGPLDGTRVNIDPGCNRFLVPSICGGAYVYGRRSLTEMELWFGCEPPRFRRAS